MSLSLILFGPGLLPVGVNDLCGDGVENRDEEGVDIWEGDGEDRRDDAGLEVIDVVVELQTDAGEEESRRRLGDKSADRDDIIFGVTSSVGRTARRSASFDGDISNTWDFRFPTCIRNQ